MTKIHQFDPQIYPRLLWVVIGERKAAPLLDTFEELQDMDESAIATTQQVYCPKQKRAGILIRFENKDAARNHQYVSHEATHAALDIFNYIGATVDAENQEPFCYLVGWISECVREAANYRNSAK